MRDMPVTGHYEKKRTVSSAKGTGHTIYISCLLRIATMMCPHSREALDGFTRTSVLLNVSLFICWIGYEVKGGSGDLL